MADYFAPGTAGLIAVGTGIRIVGQLTTETIAWLRRADRVYYLVGDPVAEAAVRVLNPDGAESLMGFYAEGKPRRATYLEITDRVLRSVRSGSLTCVVSYGHPGVFADPIHDAIRRARAEGFPSRMLPAVSAEDCLFADLGVDPAQHGCQSYDATDFLVHRRTADASCSVILWQIGGVGDLVYRRESYDLSLLPLLVERLLVAYPPQHVCYAYEAAVRFGAVARVQSVEIAKLATATLTSSTTLYIPPSRSPSTDVTILARINAMMSAANTNGSRPPVSAGRTRP